MKIICLNANATVQPLLVHNLKNQGQPSSALGPPWWRHEAILYGNRSNLHLKLMHLPTLMCWLINKTMSEWSNAGFKPVFTAFICKMKQAKDKLGTRGPSFFFMRRDHLSLFLIINFQEKRIDWQHWGWFMIFSDSIFTNWLICLGLSRLAEVFGISACLFLQRWQPGWCQQTSATPTLSISIKRTNENLMRMGLSSLHTLTKLAYKAHSHECPGVQTHLHVLQYTRVTRIKPIAWDAKSRIFRCFREESFAWMVNFHAR